MFTDWLEKVAATKVGRKLARLKMLTPAGVWQGMSLGALAALAGLAGVAFHGLTVAIEQATIERVAHIGSWGFLVGSFLIIVLGSLAASWLIAHFAPEAGGGGVMPVKLAFWRDFGMIPARTGAVKFLASAITLGTGTSLGPEGPSVQIGASTMSTAADVAHVVKQERRRYCAAGAAAGLAAVFNAPLAAITFVLEEIIGDLNSRMLGWVVVAAVVGALVAHAVLGAQPAFQTQAHLEVGWRAWALVPPVAALAATAGAVFQRGALRLRAWLAPRRKGRLGAYVPMLGAIATWACGAAAYFATGHIGIFGIGYHDITAAMQGNLGMSTALILLVGKLGATAWAVGSGGCGGIFAPALFLGAMSGSLLAALAASIVPLSGGEQAMLVMTGMAASLGAVIRTPLTCILLLFEVTNQFVIVPALMLATVVSQGVARALNRRDMYEEILEQDGVDPNQVLPPRHYKRWREVPVSALASFRPVTVDDLAPAALRELLARSRHDRFPVTGEGGRIAGVLSRREAEHAAEGHGDPRIDPPVWIHAKATVGEARRVMLQAGADFLCVGDAERGNIKGVLTLHDLLRGQSVLEEDVA